MLSAGFNGSWYCNCVTSSVRNVLSLAKPGVVVVVVAAGVVVAAAAAPAAFAADLATAGRMAVW